MPSFTFSSEGYGCVIKLQTTIGNSNRGQNLSVTLTARYHDASPQGRRISAPPRVFPRKEFFKGGDEIARRVLADIGVAEPPQALVESLALLLSKASAWVSAEAANAETLSVHLIVSAQTSFSRDARSMAARTVSQALASATTRRDNNAAFEGLQEMDSSQEGDLGMCCICRDSFDDDLEEEDDSCDRSRMVVKMPCEHCYHRDCIVRWLKTSRLCPLCRKAMPTSSSCLSNNL